MSNGCPSRIVYSSVRLWLCLAAAAALVWAGSEYSSAKQKIESIQNGQLRAGTRVTLTYPELGAWVAHEAPPGVLNPRIKVTAPGVATGSALVDFAKLQRSQGNEPGWLVSKLLNGQRPVSVTARIRSAGGTATVDVQSVEIGGFTIDGATLDFLINNVLVPMYPNAVVGKPFLLGDRIDHIDVLPAGVTAFIGR